MQSGIKAILFDYGGVLAEEGFHNGLVNLAREQGLDSVELSKHGCGRCMTRICAGPRRRGGFLGPAA